MEGLKKRKLLAGFTTFAVVAAVAATAGCATTESPSQEAEGGTPEVSQGMSNYSPDGNYRDYMNDYNLTINDNAGAENAIINAPESHIDRSGFTVQPVPNDDIGWNISYLNADNRGCTSCHTLEDALMSMPTYHGTIFMGYPTEQTYSTCSVCHGEAMPLRTSMHAAHLGNQQFENAGGTCDSCHYIDANGDFLRWDQEKYNLYKGITDIAADETDLQVSYDQTTLTPTNQMFFKSIKEYGEFAPADWRTDDSNMDPELYNNWVFTVGGEVENPISMTLPELVEQFGTITTTMVQQCTINGVGNAAVMQCEVTGVPIKAIIDYVKPKDAVNAAEMLTEDPFPNVGKHYNVPFESVNVDDAVLVLQVNGETLPNSQGYPCSLWVPRASAACAYKVSEGVNFIVAEEDAIASGLFLGSPESAEDPYAPTNKPNSAVLNLPTGVVLEGVAGTPVDIEGFADAFDEPISKIEFSWDHGATWTTLDTPDNDATRWTYWRMKFTPPDTGAYLLDIRTTSIQPDGTERVSAVNTQFLLNVK